MDTNLFYVMFLGEDRVCSPRLTRYKSLGICPHLLYLKSLTYQRI